MPEAASLVAELLRFVPEVKPYWDGCAEGRLMLTRCRDTGRAFAYPRGVSPFTLSEVEWFEASGKGVIYSLSRIQGPAGPYAIAYVTLDEGPTIFTGLVDDDAGALKIGDKVRAVFRDLDGGARVPFFAPAA